MANAIDQFRSATPRWRKTGAALALALLTAAALGATTAPATRPADDLDARYTRVLGLLKSPPVDGVLVTELMPTATIGQKDSLQPGDIITRYNDTPIRKESDLSDAVAQAIASAAAEPLDAAAIREKLDLGQPLVQRAAIDVRRGPATVTLQLPVGGLGVTVRTVEAGVASPTNPAASAPETWALAWDQVPTLAAQPGQVKGHQTWLRCYRDGALTAVEDQTLEHIGQDWTLRIRTRFVDAGRTDKADSSQLCVLRFTTGDGKQTPALALDALAWEGFGEKITAERKALIVRGTRTLAVGANAAAEVRPIAEPTLLGAVPGQAIYTLAAALPHEDKIVLPLALISEEDLRTRPGYALETLGRQKVKTHDHVDTDAWTVRLWHYGRVEMTLWFDDQCRLLKGQAGAHETFEATADEPAAWRGTKAHQ